MNPKSNKIRLPIVLLGLFFLILQLILLGSVYPFQCTGRTVSALSYIPAYLTACLEQQNNCSYNWSSNGFLGDINNSTLAAYTQLKNYTFHISCQAAKEYKCENDEFINTGGVSGGEFSLTCDKTKATCWLSMQPHGAEDNTQTFVYLGSALLCFFTGLAILIRYHSWWGILFIVAPVIIFIISAASVPVC